MNYSLYTRKGQAPYLGLHVEMLASTKYLFESNPRRRVRGISGKSVVAEVPASDKEMFTGPLPLAPRMNKCVQPASDGIPLRRSSRWYP
jgi:hypothetical protein